MSRVFDKLLLISLLGFFILFPKQSGAQRIFGVIWEVPEDTQKAIQQLEHFHNLKIEYLEIDTVVSDELWNIMKEHGFNVFVQVPVRFPVVETFATPDSALIATYRQFLSSYANRNPKAFGIFEYGQTRSKSFPDILDPFVNQLKKTTSFRTYIKDWYFQSQPADTLFDFKMLRIGVDKNFPKIPDFNFKRNDTFLYKPVPHLRDYVKPLSWFLEKTSVNKDAILFFKAEWLLPFLEEHPDTKQVFVQFATLPNALFPVPEETLPQNGNHGWIVIMLLILWASFAINYNYEPMYRKSLFRYFFSHKFFVEDVMQRHIRTTLPGLIILIQHALMGGIFLYSFAGIYFSSTGIEAFFHHFPDLNLFGTELFEFFLIGTLVTFLYQLFCMIWLYLTNRELKYLSQLATLYSWSLQLNLPVVTIIVTLLMAGGTGTFIMVFLFLLFLAVMIATFPLAAFDSGQHLRRFKVLYFTVTIGIYFFAIGGTIFWFFHNSYMLNVLRLAIALP